MAEEGGTVFPPQVTQVETEAQMKSPKLAQGHLDPNQSSVVLLCCTLVSE